VDAVSGWPWHHRHHLDMRIHGPYLLPDRHPPASPPDLVPPSQDCRPRPLSRLRHRRPRSRYPVRRPRVCGSASCSLSAKGQGQVVCHALSLRLKGGYRVEWSIENAIGKVTLPLTGYVTALPLQRLISHGMVSSDQVPSKEAIEDKGKADGLVKSIAVVRSARLFQTQTAASSWGRLSICASSGTTGCRRHRCSIVMSCRAGGV
jgi:hypothetical protein